MLLHWFRRCQNAKDTKAAALVALTLLLAEVALCTAIIYKVPYTKIDWDAYMEQVTGFLAGERDYSQLKGDTGPLVYPAGFLYVFSGLQFLTGGQVPPAQVVFAALYVANLAVVFLVYIRAQTVPPWALVMLCLSKRVHSIFVLRLFNDCFAMFLAYCSISILQTRRWNLGLIVFSAAVSIKMNVLLFAPPLLLILFKGTSWLGVFVALSCAAVVQVLLGLPFLLTYPWQYMAGAFNFGRVFIHFWSVNFKFVPESIFLSKPWATMLLVLHLGTLFLFAALRWCRQEGGILAAVGLKRPSLIEENPSTKAKGKANAEDAPIVKSTLLTEEHITTMLLTGNFVGIVFARTLHYQFYSWYFHSIPYLLWRTKLPTIAKAGLMLAIEVCWNVYPSTALSSLTLCGCHLVLLLSLFAFPSHDSPKPPRKKAE